jgi:hypothetical protein
MTQVPVGSLGDHYPTISRDDGLAPYATGYDDRAGDTQFRAHGEERHVNGFGR